MPIGPYCAEAGTNKKIAVATNAAESISFLKFMINVSIASTKIQHMPINVHITVFILKFRKY